MAIYKVQDPAGRIREIEGPDGASDEEILSQAQRLFGASTPKTVVPEKSEEDARRDAIQQAFDDSTGFQKFGIGVAKPFVEGYHGVRKMLGGKADPEAEARLKAIHGGAATAGELAGNVAAFALPGGAIARGLSTAPKAALLADATLNAVASGTQSLGRGDSFGEGAAWGAGGSAVGAGIGRGIQGARNAFSYRDGAKELIDAGVPLTPGQAANSGLQRAENALANVPVIGTPIRKLQNKAVEGWNRNVLRDVVPDATGITKGGNEGFQQATKQFSDAYDDLFKGEVPLAQENKFVLDSVIDDLDQISALERGSAKEVLERLSGDLSGAKISGRTIERWDDELRQLSVAASRKGNVAEAEAYREAREYMKDMIPPEMKDQWASLDKQFRKFATTRKAATYQGAAKNRGVFTPAELLRAAGAQDKSAGKRAFAQGTAPLQKEALDAADILQLPSRGLAEQLSLPVGLAAAAVHLPTAATAYVGSRAAVNEPMRKLIVEKLMRKAPLTPQEIEQATRWGLIGGGAAGATAE